MSAQFMPEKQTSGHPAVEHRETGVLLVNLGTPDAPTPSAIRRYLGEFLSDRRMIEFPRPLWWFILNGIILNTRPRSAAARYATIWRHGDNLSPLAYYTHAQAKKLDAKMPQNVKVYWAMRYGNPSIADTIAKMQTDGCQRILVIALYPQYSATTSASVYDEVFRTLAKMRWQPALRTAPPWYDHPAYIDALATSLRDHIAKYEIPPDAIIASFHGIPERYFKNGDPYYCHCAKTTRLLENAIGQNIELAFQSRFGGGKWLQPYLSDVVRAHARAGHHITIITPGFIADCLETLEEIDIDLRPKAYADGAQSFDRVDCLNDSNTAMDFLHQLTKSELGQWYTPKFSKTTHNLHASQT